MITTSIERPVRARSRLVLPVVLLAALAISLGISGTAIALQSIARELGSDPAGLQWVVNGFNLTFAACTLIWGALSDRIGSRRAFVAGLVLLILGSVGSAVAPQIAVLDIARLVSGIGAAALITCGSSILANAFEGAERGRAFALFGTTIGVGLSFGPTISGALIDSFGWRGVFVWFAVIAALALLGSGRLPHIVPVRVPGRRSIDFSVLRNRGFLALVLVPTAGAIGYVTILSYLPTALSAVLGLSAGAAGVFVLPLTLPVLAGPLLASQLIRRVAWIRPITIIYTALGCLVLGDLGLLLLGPGVPAGWIVLPMVLLGFGFGFPIGIVDGEALAQIPARSTGTAAGVLDFVRQASEAVAVGAYAAILSAGIAATLGDRAIADATFAGGHGHAAAYAGTFHVIVAGMAIAVALLSVVIVMLQRSHRRSAVPAP